MQVKVDRDQCGKEEGSKQLMFERRCTGREGVHRTGFGRRFLRKETERIQYVAAGSFDVVTAVEVHCYRPFGKMSDVSIMPSDLSTSQRSRALPV